MERLFQHRVKLGMLGLILILGFLTPMLGLGQNTTYSTSYDLKFPHNDVTYSPKTGTKRVINLPSMDIQEVIFEFKPDTFFEAQMILGGTPYVNNSIYYDFMIMFGIGSSSGLGIQIKNGFNTTINNSTITLGNLNTFGNKSQIVNIHQEYINPTITGNIITWDVDLHNLDVIIPLSSIFNQPAYSSENSTQYQKNIQFSFSVKNDDSFGYNVNIYNEYTITSLGEPPHTNIIYAVFWAIGLIFISTVVYLVSKMRNKGKSNK